jgi:uncharacterized protein (TIGR04255 family)
LVKRGIDRKLRLAFSTRPGTLPHSLAEASQREFAVIGRDPTSESRVLRAEPLRVAGGRPACPTGSLIEPCEERPISLTTESHPLALHRRRSTPGHDTIDSDAMSRREDLPSYRRPPVSEVVCGVQFGPIHGFGSVHFGKLWAHIKSEYPRTKDVAPLAEIFEGERGAQVRDDLVSLELPPLRRVFYETEDGNFLLQVQPTRFLSNWKKERENDQYPRFTAAYQRFIRGWQTFLTFIGEEKLGAPQVNQYELTYINHITEATRAFPGGIGEHLRVFNWAEENMLILSKPRAANCRISFPLPNGKGTLHVTVGHGVRPTDNTGVMVLELTARGPARSDWSDMQVWFHLAHEWIVKGFTDLTTSAAHRRWEREG